MIRSPQTFVTLTAIAVFACSMALTSQAAVIAYESFESASLGAFDGSGDETWSAAETIVSQDLSYTGGSVSISGGDQSYRLDETGDNVAVNSFTFTSQTGDVYFRFLASSVTDGHFLQPYVSDDADEKNSASGIFDNRSPSDIVGGRLTGSKRKSSGDLGDSAGSNVLFIGKLWKSGDSGVNYDRLSISINPEDYTETWDVTLSQDIGISAVDTFGLRTYGGGTSGAARPEDISYIDEIVIGTEFSDVLAIPEPGTYALLAGLTGLTFVMLRRRR